MREHEPMTFDPDVCRFRKRRPDHVCRDAFGDVIPDGSDRVCFAEARMQLLELELAKSLVDDVYADDVVPENVVSITDAIERKLAGGRK